MIETETHTLGLFLAESETEVFTTDSVRVKLRILRSMPPDWNVLSGRWEPGCTFTCIADSPEDAIAAARVVPDLADRNSLYERETVLGVGEGESESRGMMFLLENKRMVRAYFRYAIPGHAERDQMRVILDRAAPEVEAMNARIAALVEKYAA